MVKKIIGYIKLQVPAGKANPSLMSVAIGEAAENSIVENSIHKFAG